jgi:hypothetical protein
MDQKTKTTTTKKVTPGLAKSSGLGASAILSGFKDGLISESNGKTALNIDTTTETSNASSALSTSVADYSSSISMIPEDIKGMGIEQCQADIKKSEIYQAQLSASIQREKVVQQGEKLNKEKTKTARYQMKSLEEKARLGEQVVRTSYAFEKAKLTARELAAKNQINTARTEYWEEKSEVDSEGYAVSRKENELNKLRNAVRANRIEKRISELKPGEKK